MRLTITSTGFAPLLRRTRQAPLRLRERTWQTLRLVSEDTAASIKTRMPVASGRARDSWADANAPDGIYDEQPDALTITQGSTRAYIRFLNEGSSRQAPAGFLDAAARIAAAELVRRLSQPDDTL